jgi:bifunctional non-homologous end joining protein LigD
MAATWELDLDGTTVSVTHPDKVVFGELGLTKRDLVTYYLSVVDRVLPAVRGRPMILTRYVHGVENGAFFQKRAPQQRPRLGADRRAALPLRDER